jgi:hypothetical protein
LCETGWSYSPNEILNDGPCAKNLIKFGQNAFKHEHKTEGLHQTKLETDSFTSPRCIFLM